ncbi:MAG: enoyl-CoA hydratase-related protein [Peptoniphilaceae bacterium]|nr:enoyl-CoA hydratase-related protein [Peptoniphilaceae bacterium]MDY6085801.1 enoyl-CoA hydratase-related protein [Peptoniphilaceae bacterium]
MAFVKLETEGAVSVVTIDRPKAMNALNPEVLHDLEAAFDAIDQEVARVVVLTGSGDKSFVAGADIAAMAQYDEQQAEEFGREGNRIFRKIETFPLPVIAAVNGFALGGGNELAMACDIRYASENAVFGQPEVGLGITPGFGGTQRLMRVIGSRSSAREIIFSARNIKADEALRIGLVSKVFPVEELMPAVMKLANNIAKNAPVAVRLSKQAMNEGADQPMAEAIETEVAAFAKTFTTEDVKEGMGAFLEKRKEKHFKNR